MAAPRLRYVYAGIEVRDLARSLRFYRGLGFRIFRRGVMGHGGRWVHLKLPGMSSRLELNHYPRQNRFARPWRSGSELDHIGFFADDPDAWAERVVKLGGRREARIDGPHEWLVYASDPDGIWLEFIGDPAVRDARATARRSASASRTAARRRPGSSRARSRSGSRPSP